MRRRFSSSLASSVGALATLAVAFLCGLPRATAISFTAVPSSNLDIGSLGRVAFTGDFDALSLFEFEGQNQLPFATNGSQSLLSRFPNGAFTSLSSADAYIMAMCPLVQSDGSLKGVVIGGNFTSLGGVEAQGVALFDPNSGNITPIPGLSGRVAALFCDSNSSSVYIGGSFSAANSTNAIVWNTTDLENLPFAGFNGPVTAITKASTGNIIFGGSFTGLGNTTTPKQKDSQQIPISSANITSGSSTTTAGFSDPRNIICKEGEDGSGNAWLLEDNTPGFWEASFQFGFQPTKLRLYNTKQDGRGTKTWRFTALPINGIMNLTYVDETGKTAFCDARCPLPQNNNTFQDFHFVNLVGMNSFRIDISEFYGNGGGLAGIELFEDDIFSYAINSFNQPICSNGKVSTTSLPSSTVTGNWAVSPSLQSTSEWLTISLNDTTIDPNEAQVVFIPDVVQSGNYSITIFTPGCIQDGTCLTRGRVNITASVKTSGTQSATQAMTTELFQTNNFDKYDQIYLGFVEASSPPQITLQPSSGQSGPLTVVAQRVRFELLSNSSSSSGLNGLFEYNPSQQEIDSSQFSSSIVDSAGISLDGAAVITSLVVIDDTLYAGGDFSSDNASNVLKITGQGFTSLSGGGLNSEVLAMFQNDTQIYVGGNFTGTKSANISGLNGIALYSSVDDSWSPLGAGVNGVVTNIVPFTLNFTANKPETVLAVVGFFDEVLGFGSNETFSADGIAIWVPSRNNWLVNTGLVTISLKGQLAVTTEVPGFSPLFAGSISSQALGTAGAVGLSGSSDLSLQELPVKIQQTESTSLTKRAVSDQNVTGTTTGLIYGQNGLNITIIAGHFTATGSNGANISNIMFINGTTSVTGIGDDVSTDSTVLALGTQGTTLYAGGSISGNVNGNQVAGIVAYDLASASFSSSQPDGLVGTSVTVNAIAPQPSSTKVFVGGNFISAGSLSCPAVCVYDTQRNQWNQPATGISGVVNAMLWISNTKLILAGNLTVGKNVTTVATFDTSTNQFSSFNGANNIPGPVTSLSVGDKEGSQLWVAGQANNGSAFLEKYDGSQWISASAGLDAASTIRGIQVFHLLKNHDQSDLLDPSLGLLVLGSLVIPDFGNSSSALFNGTTFTPFVLSTSSTNTGGTLAQVFVENPDNFFQNEGKHLAVGFVVLIGLAIALGLIFLLTVGGFLAERQRRMREGYVPAPTSMPTRSDNMSRIPPSQLFGTIGQSQRPAHI